MKNSHGTPNVSAFFAVLALCIGFLFPAETSAKTQRVSVQEPAEDTCAVPEGAVAVHNADDFLDIQADLQSGIVDRHYFLCNSIILVEEYAPVPVEFQGTLDGNGYKLLGLYIDQHEVSTGLFFSLSGSAVIRNLKIVDPKVRVTDSFPDSDPESDSENSAGVVTASNSGLIENIHIETSDDILGAAEYIHDNTEVPQDVKGWVNARHNAGGIAGVNQQGGVIQDSSVAGAFSVVGRKFSKRIGGIAGVNHGTILNTRNEARSVEGWHFIGGAVGVNGPNAVIRHAVNHSTVGLLTTWGDSWTGGIAGQNGALLEYVYNYGNVHGKVYVGGIAGLMTPGSRVVHAGVEDIEIIAKRQVGGIVGRVDGGYVEDVAAVDITINATFPYPQSKVVGGIAGELTSGDSSIDGAYAKGTIVTSGYETAGIAGRHYGDFIRKSYADIVFVIQDDNTGNEYSIGGITTGQWASNMEMVAFNESAALSQLPPGFELEHSVYGLDGSGCSADTSVLSACSVQEVTLSSGHTFEEQEVPCPQGCEGTATYLCNEYGQWEISSNDCHVLAGCPAMSVETHPYCGNIELSAAPHGETVDMGCPNGCGGTVDGQCVDGNWVGDYDCSALPIMEYACSDYQQPWDFQSALNWPWFECTEVPEYPRRDCPLPRGYFLLYYTLLGQNPDRPCTGPQQYGSFCIEFGHLEPSEFFSPECIYDPEIFNDPNKRSECLGARTPDVIVNDCSYQEFGFSPEQMRNFLQEAGRQRGTYHYDGEEYDPTIISWETFTSVAEKIMGVFDSLF